MNTDISGPSIEGTIDSMIEDVKKDIEKAVAKSLENIPTESDSSRTLEAQMKKQAAIAIKKLWIDKINQDLKL